MQILTADIMEMLIEFKKQSKIPYDIYIKNNEVYIRFQCGEMFEVSNILKGIVNEKEVKNYYNILEFSYSLISEITKTIEDVNI